MINLYYDESYWGGKMNGPHKVVSNLIKSLQQEDIKFSINEEKYEHNFLIQYDVLGHEKHSKIELDTCIIGPQVWMFDVYGQFLIDHPNYYKKIIAPCQWVKDKFINKFNLPENKISIWPVGIELLNVEKKIEFDCLIYFKRRTTYELKLATDFLDSLGLTYKILSYGNYSNDDLENLCEKCKFCFLLNGTESQGIAVQEIMSTNTPLFVWDVIEWNDQGEKYKVPATSVPYWSDNCGKVFYGRGDIDVAFSEFYAKIDEYSPRKYIEDNLSFKQSINKLMEIIND
jgi:hypothetical protein